MVACYVVTCYSRCYHIACYHIACYYIICKYRTCHHIACYYITCYYIICNYRTCYYIAYYWKVPHGISSLCYDASISIYPGRHFSAAFLGTTQAMADASTASGEGSEDRIFTTDY